MVSVSCVDDLVYKSSARVSRCVLVKSEIRSVNSSDTQRDPWGSGVFACVANKRTWAHV